jgi:hypothetical protein
VKEMMEEMVKRCKGDDNRLAQIYGEIDGKRSSQ